LREVEGVFGGVRYSREVRAIAVGYSLEKPTVDVWVGFLSIVVATNWTVSAVVRPSCRTWWRGVEKPLLESAGTRPQKAIVECML
jgi:hypothetical protein